MQAEPQKEREWTIVSPGACFRVRALHQDDQPRHAEYQALRARIFAEHLRWQVVVTPDGCEIDRYDQRADPTIQAHTVALVEQEQEHLLSGVRTFALRSWEESMVMHEFRAVGMFPADVLTALQEAYPADTLLEVTRLCVQRREPGALIPPLHLRVAQDLIYAAVYRVAESTGRSLVLAVVSTGYQCLLQRAGFAVLVLHACQHDHKTGYALTIIDLVASMHTMRAMGKQEQAARLLALCQDDRWHI